MENNMSLNNDIIIEVNNVSRCFNLARERVDSLKEYVVRRIKGNLHFDEFWALKDVNFTVKGFDSDLTARENIYLNGALLGHPRSFMRDVYDEIVDFAELYDFMDVPVKNFSSGMTSRLAFSIATIGKPDILIVDEVLAVGDTVKVKVTAIKDGKLSLSIKEATDMMAKEIEEEVYEVPDAGEQATTSLGSLFANIKLD